MPGVNSWCCCFDTLHCLDTKGMASHLCGSVIHQLIYEKVSGRQANDEITRLWQRMQEIYDGLGTRNRMTHLQLSMICSVDKPHADYPCLHASGAETRHLVPVLAQLAAEEGNGSEVSKHRVWALEALAKFYNTCDQSPMFMTDDASDSALLCMEGFLSHYRWLHHVALAAGRWLYSLRPKFHFCWHLAYDCRFMNARHKWTYKCESWVGKVSHMASSCSSGTRMTKITVPLAQKYRLYVHVRLQRQVFED